LLAGSMLKLEASAGLSQNENWDDAIRKSSKQVAFWCLVLDMEMF